MCSAIIDNNITSEVCLQPGLTIRKFIESDFSEVQRLYKREGWMTFINRGDEALEVWKNSPVALVAMDGDKIVGLVRALTDGRITTYIAEIIVDADYRGRGIGKALLDTCHKLYPTTRFDLLSTDESEGFYKSNNFRTNIGFRKSCW